MVSIEILPLAWQGCVGDVLAHSYELLFHVYTNMDGQQVEDKLSCTVKPAFIMGIQNV